MKTDDLETSPELTVFCQEDVLENIRLEYPFQSANFSIIHIERGSLHLLCNAKFYILNGNSLFFALPGSKYEIRKKSEDCSFIGCSFTKSYLQSIGIYTESEKMARIFSDKIQMHCMLTTEESRDVCSDLTSLYRKTKYDVNTPYLNQILKYSFLAFLYTSSLVFYRGNDVPKMKLNRSEEIADNFIAFLNTYIKTERSVQFYADSLHISLRHLSKVIKNVLGKSPSVVINEGLIREAKILLSNKFNNISEISDMLQFSDPSSFGKYFKRYSGYTPTEYRQSFQNINIHLF
ncbi:helix-turn-helix domain-containing protein [Pedobacter alluvionis]|uniref:AraC family transcriptional regulator n=1 Tax=Pedobacter alluvionis TaxID=475253 RepID=A0A497Y4U0_9SPHI|nr:helix-turn-helix transcriptional regulator [Pedobacter alluvionis]RLJ75088.1 AraC-like DNA-binding protein [Pedobacter alluvionis]TFB30196.1 AraC family transcriptional regulator [Pedobacter alluvionis]